MQTYCSTAGIGLVDKIPHDELVGYRRRVRRIHDFETLIIYLEDQRGQVSNGLLANGDERFIEGLVSNQRHLLDEVAP